MDFDVKVNYIVVCVKTTDHKTTNLTCQHSLLLDGFMVLVCIIVYGKYGQYF